MPHLPPRWTTDIVKSFGQPNNIVPRQVQIGGPATPEMPQLSATTIVATLTQGCRRYLDSVPEDTTGEEARVRHIGQDLETGVRAT